MGKHPKKDKKHDANDRRRGFPIILFGIFGVVLAAAVGVAWVGKSIVPEWVRAWEREFKTDDFRFKGWAERMKVEAPGVTGLVHRNGWGWALQAQEDIEANKTQIRLPPTIVLSSETISSYPAQNETLHKNLEDITEICNDDGYLLLQAMLTISLLHERYLGKGSAYREWISTLPETFKNDLYWGTDEVSCLPEQAKRARIRRKVAVSRISKIIKKYFKHLDERDVVWGYSVVLSRSWRRGDGLVVYPVVDIADQRARHYGKSVWRPLPVNSRLELTSDGFVKIITTKKVKKGEYLSVSPLPILTPTEAAPLYGILDPDFTHILSHLDLSDAAPSCTQDTLHLFANGTATPHTISCLLKYREVPPDAPEDVKRATVSKFLTFHATHMLQQWVLPETGACRANNLANMPNGPEILNLITSHVYTFRKCLSAYKGKK